MFMKVNLLKIFKKFKLLSLKKLKINKTLKNK